MVFPFNHNDLLSQSHQVHIRESENPTRGWSRYFLFLPFERQSRSLTIVPASLAEREREREMSGVTNPVDSSSVFLSQPFKYPISSPRTRIGTSLMPRKGSRSLISLFGCRSPTSRIWTHDSQLGDFRANFSPFQTQPGLPLADI